MKIARLEPLHADTGQRVFDFLKMVKPEIRDGHVLLPTGPGWGTEVNEKAVLAHPLRKR
jgi:L-alanine-DL-glutamate epimerase-like enolase superfamily enzyme